MQIDFGDYEWLTRFIRSGEASQYMAKAMMAPGLAFPDDWAAPRPMALSANGINVTFHIEGLPVFDSVNVWGIAYIGPGMTEWRERPFDRGYRNVENGDLIEVELEFANA